MLGYSPQAATMAVRDQCCRNPSPLDKKIVQTRHTTVCWVDMPRITSL